MLAANATNGNVPSRGRLSSGRYRRGFWLWTQQRLTLACAFPSLRAATLTDVITGWNNNYVAHLNNIGMSASSHVYAKLISRRCSKPGAPAFQSHRSSQNTWKFGVEGSIAEVNAAQVTEMLDCHSVYRAACGMRPKVLMEEGISHLWFNNTRRNIWEAVVCRCPFSHARVILLGVDQPLGRRKPPHRDPRTMPALRSQRLA